MQVDLLSFFSFTYSEARAKFSYACQSAGARVTNFKNPYLGLENEYLYTDIALFGDNKSSKCLFITSGVHGVEGFLGSACQIGWIARNYYQRIPSDVSVILVHAVNPYGFSWLRRVTEGNVDLNRNFIDHNSIYPENPLYSELLNSLCPKSWDEAFLQIINRDIETFKEKYGNSNYQKVLTKGQYKYPDGIFYGGVEPTWSNLTFRKIAEKFCKNKKRLIFLDFHTGLGSYGDCELISCSAKETDNYRYAKELFGEVASITSDSSKQLDICGDIQTGLTNILPTTELINIALEYGTYSFSEIIDTLRADNWLHLYGDLQNKKGKKIKEDIRNAFYPDSDAWKKQVWTQAEYVLAKALEGLSKSN
jgi:hypothetical protein